MARRPPSLGADRIHPAGPLTHRDLVSVLPMLDETVIIEVTGKEAGEGRGGDWGEAEGRGGGGGEAESRWGVGERRRGGDACCGTPAHASSALPALLAAACPSPACLAATCRRTAVGGAGERGQPVAQAGGAVSAGAPLHRAAATCCLCSVRLPGSSGLHARGLQMHASRCSSPASSVLTCLLHLLSADIVLAAGIRHPAVLRSLLAARPARAARQRDSGRCAAAARWVQPPGMSLQAPAVCRGFVGKHRLGNPCRAQLSTRASRVWF